MSNALTHDQIRILEETHRQGELWVFHGNGRRYEMARLSRLVKRGYLEREVRRAGSFGLNIYKLTQIGKDAVESAIDQRALAKWNAAVERKPAANAGAEGGEAE